MSDICLKDKFLVLKYRKLYMLKIEFSNKIKHISKETIFEIINQIDTETKMVSIVTNSKDTNIELLEQVVTMLKK